MDVALSQGFKDAEVALVVAASADKVLARETYLPPCMDAEQARRWVIGQRWAYFIVYGGEPVGMVLFHPKPSRRGVAEVETWLLERYRGLGISQTAHPLVVDEAAKYWNYLTAWVWNYNSGSLGLVSHTAFAPTGKRYEVDGKVCTELRLTLPKV